MPENRPETSCPDCRDVPSRRDFVKAVGGGAIALAGGVLPRFGSTAARAQDIAVGPTPAAAAETAVKRLFDTLTSEQRGVICKSFDDPLRLRINANWAITDLKIDEFSSEQQEIIREIFQGVTSPDGYDRFMKQMDGDSGGFDQYHIALFGEPGAGPFEFEMTGRHLTIRADGNSVEGAAFGGPIVYGHGEGDSQKGLPGNVFYYQTQKANEVFQALDGTQREKALVEKAPTEAAVQIQGQRGRFPGINVGELSSDQKELVGSVLRVVLAPYRQEDIDEAMAIVEQGGGLDALRMAFYQADDLGDDQEWDLWRIESPTFVCHFRGAPHVHAYLNVATKA